MDWNTLLCEKRQTASNKKSWDDRNEFQRDYHRIVGSASFRRLQDKTQVFPLDNSDFVRTRLTHSIEVSSFAKSLGQSCFLELKDKVSDAGKLPTPEQVVKICNILECAGLLHDIGNPPFGHFGEYSIRNWFANNLDKYTVDGRRISDMPVADNKAASGNERVMRLSDALTDQMKGDLLHFEGNAQALRLLTKLHFLVDEKGMHLTFALLNTIIKYPVDSLHINKKSGNIKDKKMGYYYAEQELFRDITSSTGAVNCRYPLVYLLEAADDIAYATADLEDGVKKGYVTYEDIIEALRSQRYTSMLTDDESRERYDRALNRLMDNYKRACEERVANPKINAVQNWIIYMQGVFLHSARKGFIENYDEIMDGTYGSEILAYDSVGRALLAVLKETSVKYIFQHEDIAKIELSANTMIEFYLDHFVPAVIKYDADSENPYELLNEIDKRYIKLISDNYMRAYHYAAANLGDGEEAAATKLYLRLLLATDYICGMTDSYARDLYRELTGV